MKKIVIVILFLALAIPGLVFAQDHGPTLTSVTVDILRIVRQDGRWYPIYGWSVLNPLNPSELKVAVLDSAGKTLSYAVFSLRKETSDFKGDWYKTTDMTSQWPSKDYEKLRKLPVGNYTMQIISGGQVIWETPFEVGNIIDAKHKELGSANHFYITGPWRDLAYAYAGTGSNGLNVSFWFQGPKDLNWYSEDNCEWTGALRCEVRKDGQLIISKQRDVDANFALFPWLVRKSFQVICPESDLKEKILSSDGDYEVIVYAEAGTYENWVPAVRFILPVRGGKISANPELSGDKVDPKHRFITTDAYYARNLVKDQLPPSKR
jgi:hypothetical protein